MPVIVMSALTAGALGALLIRVVGRFLSVTGLGVIAMMVLMPVVHLFLECMNALLLDLYGVRNLLSVELFTVLDTVDMTMHLRLSWLNAPTHVLWRSLHDCRRFLLLTLKEHELPTMNLWLCRTLVWGCVLLWHPARTRQTIRGRLPHEEHLFPISNANTLLRAGLSRQLLFPWLRRCRRALLHLA